MGNNGKVAEILALARLQGQLSSYRDRDRDARLDSSCLPGHGGCVTLLLACWLAA